MLYSIHNLDFYRDFILYLYGNVFRFFSSACYLSFAHTLSLSLSLACSWWFRMNEFLLSFSFVCDVSPLINVNAAGAYAPPLSISRRNNDNLRRRLRETKLNAFYCCRWCAFCNRHKMHKNIKLPSVLIHPHPCTLDYDIPVCDALCSRTAPSWCESVCSSLSRRPSLIFLIFQLIQFR